MKPAFHHAAAFAISPQRRPNLLRRDSNPQARRRPFVVEVSDFFTPGGVFTFLASEPPFSGQAPLPRPVSRIRFHGVQPLTHTLHAPPRRVSRCRTLQCPAPEAGGPPRALYPFVYSENRSVPGALAIRATGGLYPPAWIRTTKYPKRSHLSTLKTLAHIRGSVKLLFRVGQLTCPSSHQYHLPFLSRAAWWECRSGQLHLCRAGISHLIRPLRPLRPLQRKGRSSHGSASRSVTIGLHRVFRVMRLSHFGANIDQRVAP